MPNWLERTYPYLIIAFSFVFALSVSADDLPAGVDALLGAALTFSAISIGFVGTALSVVVSIDDSKLVAELKKTGYHASIMSYAMECINLFFVVTIGCLLGLFDGFASDSNLVTLAFHAWASVLAGAIASLYRFIRLLRTFLVTNSAVAQKSGGVSPSRGASSHSHANP